MRHIKGDLILKEDTVFDESIEVEGDIRGYRNLTVKGDIHALNIVALNIVAQDIDAWNIDARNIDALNIVARNIDARNIHARNIDARDIVARDIDALNIVARDIICEKVNLKKDGYVTGYSLTENRSDRRRKVLKRGDKK